MEKIRSGYLYVRDDNWHPVGCIAYDLFRDGPGWFGRVLTIGCSRWNKADRFNRASARCVADFRLEHCPAVYAYDSSCMYKELAFVLLQAAHDSIEAACFSRSTGFAHRAPPDMRKVTRRHLNKPYMLEIDQQICEALDLEEELNT